MFCSWFKLCFDLEKKQKLMTYFGYYFSIIVEKFELSLFLILP